MSTDDLDLAQALADISKGETTATALENHLNTLESKIDEVLAAFEGETMSQNTSSTEEAREKEVDAQSSDVKPQKSSR